MKLTAGSDRQAGARRFGLALRRAMKAHGRTQRGLAAEARIGRSRLVNWLGGTSLPPVETAEQLADLLMAPELTDLARQARVRSCDECGREFVDESPGPQRYCSAECKRSHAKVAAGARDLSRAVLERRARRYAAAVGAMCAACEPSGVCRTPTCPLQVAGVSPLRLAVAS